MAFESLQGWRLHHLPGHLHQCSATLPVQKCVLSSEGPSYVSVCARGSWGCPWPHPLCSLPPGVCPQGGDALSLLCSRLGSRSSLSLSSWQRCSSPSITLMAPCWTLSSLSLSPVLGSPALGPALQGWPHWCGAERKDPLPPPAVTQLPVQPRTLFCIAAGAHFWLMGILVSSRTLPNFSFPTGWPPADTGACGCSSPRTGLSTCH